MAIVEATYDTVTKKLKIEHDDKELENVKSASFYHTGKNKDGQDTHDMQVQMHKKDDEHDVHHTHTMYAKQCIENKTQEKIIAFLKHTLEGKTIKQRIK